jgi:hypothetical protein
MTVSLLPRKTKPQEWTDVPLPGFDELVPTPTREKSKKDEDDDAHKIKYRRYRGARSIVCHDCAYEGAEVVLSATFIRIYQGMERYLCSGHATHRRDLTDKNESNQ